MAIDGIGVLRLVHVLSAIVAVGLGAFSNLVAVPAMARMTPPERGRFVATVIRPTSRWAIGALDLLVFTGVGLGERLYWQFGDWTTTDSAKALLLGLVIAVALLLNAHLVLTPLSKRMTAAATAGRPPAPGDMARMRVAGPLQFSLGVAAVLLMVAAAHFGASWPEGALLVVVGGGATFALVAWLAARAARGAAPPAAVTPAR